MTDYVEVFNNSFERVTGSQATTDFFELFYQRFVARSEEIKGKFANTDMSRQRAMLRRSLTTLLTFYTTKRSSEQLERVAARHGKENLDIAPRLYDEWLEALIEAVSATDSAASSEVELAWRVVFAPGIAFMKHRHAHPLR